MRRPPGPQGEETAEEAPAEAEDQGPPDHVAPSPRQSSRHVGGQARAATWFRGGRSSSPGVKYESSVIPFDSCQVLSHTYFHVFILNLRIAALVNSQSVKKTLPA